MMMSELDLHTDRIKVHRPLMQTSGRTLRICIVASKFLGPVKSGGTALAFRELALTLAEAGHDVTVLYVGGERSDTSNVNSWARLFARSEGFKFVPLFSDPRYHLSKSTIFNDAYHVARFLLRHSFDVVHTHEYGAFLYFALNAKTHEGLFRRTRFVTQLHGSTGYLRKHAGQPPYPYQFLERSMIERYACSMSDYVISPSRYLVEEYYQAGWRFRRIPEILPNLMEDKAEAKRRLRQELRIRRKRRNEEQFGTANPVPHKISEHRTNGLVGDSITTSTNLTFFGQLSEIKGLVEFCDAIDILYSSQKQEFSVTFLGGVVSVEGISSKDYIIRRAEHWPVEPEVILNKGRYYALATLQEENRVAIMPSRQENSPYAVTECVALGIPFLTKKVGGIPELINKGDVDKVTYEGGAQVLAQRLARIIDQGEHHLAQPLIDQTELRDKWLKFHDDLPILHKQGSVVGPPTTEISESSVEDTTAPMTICVLIDTSVGEANSRAQAAVATAQSFATERPDKVCIIFAIGPDQCPKTTEWVKLAPSMTDNDIEIVECNSGWNQLVKQVAGLQKDELTIFLHAGLIADESWPERISHIREGTSVSAAGIPFAFELEDEWNKSANLILSVGGIETNHMTVERQERAIIVQNNLLLELELPSDQFPARDFNTILKVALQGRGVKVGCLSLTVLHMRPSNDEASSVSKAGQKMLARIAGKRLPKYMEHLPSIYMAQYRRRHLGRNIATEQNGFQRLTHVSSSTSFRLAERLRGYIWRITRRGNYKPWPVNARDERSAALLAYSYTETPYWDLLGPLRFVARLVAKLRAR